MLTNVQIKRLIEFHYGNANEIRCDRWNAEAHKRTHFNDDWKEVI